MVYAMHACMSTCGITLAQIEPAKEDNDSDVADSSLERLTCQRARVVRVTCVTYCWQIFALGTGASQRVFVIRNSRQMLQAIQLAIDHDRLLHLRDG